MAEKDFCLTIEFLLAIDENVRVVPASHPPSPDSTLPRRIDVRGGGGGVGYDS